VAARVHFCGIRAHAAIPALLPAFDIALVPAINPYASPLKLHEYMAASLATIAPDQPNLREVLEHDVNALLVPSGDGDALAGALLRLADDSALRTRLGTAARRTIESRDLTWRGNAARVIGEVQNLRAQGIAPW
jgi:glycosyltransferase involved in cell wall biosynthesis